jgi:hypothetical protein
MATGCAPLSAFVFISEPLGRNHAVEVSKSSELSHASALTHTHSAAMPDGPPLRRAITSGIVRLCQFVAASRDVHWNVWKHLNVVVAWAAESCFPLCGKEAVWLGYELAGSLRSGVGRYGESVPLLHINRVLTGHAPGSYRRTGTPRYDVDAQCCWEARTYSNSPK